MGIKSKLHLGQISVGVFVNDQGFTSYKLQKSYKKDGEWKNTEFFSASDLPTVKELCKKIIDAKIEIKKVEPRQESTNSSEFQDDVPF